MFASDWELGHDCVEVLSYLGSTLSICESLIGFLHRLMLGDVDRMRIPSVDVLSYELMIEALQDPMVQVIFPQLALDVAVACHDHDWLERATGIRHMDLCLLHLIARTANGASLDRRLGSRVVEASIAKWEPLLPLLVVTEYVSTEVVHEAMIPLKQLTQHIWANCLLDFRD